MNIYSILSSKPHNPHYLNRYITFIEKCQSKNIDYNGYTEKHHICPRAKDMFPEYSSFRENKWNLVNLTPRQHFIAHIMLWKIYKNRSTTFAVGSMNYNKDIDSRLYQNIKTEFSKAVSKQMSNTVSVKDKFGKSKRITKKEFDMCDHIQGHTKGMTFAIDKDGKGFYVSTDDERLKNGTLKGNNAGTITITDGAINKRIRPNECIPEGFYRGMTKETPIGSFWINDGNISRMHKGDEIPSGWSKGRIFSKKPTYVGSKGMVWVNNGKESKMCKPENIKPGWTRGRII